MSTNMGKADAARQDSVAERASGEATGRGDAWDGAEVRLVADRTHGSTHRFFRGWRFEVVTGAGHAAPGTVLFAVPLDPRELATAGRTYDLVRLVEPHGLLPDTATFSWVATSPPGPTDPLGEALERAEARISAAGEAGRAGFGSAASGSDG